MTSKSKNKGSAYEREVSKFLSELYGEPFVRVPNSGAYTGGSNSHRKIFLNSGQIKTFKSDLIAPDSWVNFNAECKNYAEFAFHQLFEECSTLETWIKQLINASDNNDLNILFIKISRKGRYVAVQANKDWDKSCNHMIYTSPKFGSWMIYSFENFFKVNSTQLKTYSQKPKILLETNHIL